MKSILILFALAALLNAPGTWVPVLMSPAAAQASPEGMREMTREEGEALYEWARRYLLEIGSREDEGRRSIPTDLERLRAMYFMSVEDRGWIQRAEALLHDLEERPATSLRDRVVLDSYRGALEVVRARHARWPPTRLQHLRDGMEILDRIVGEEPRNLEARYLRLVSCYYLPFFFRREESVREDFQVLVGALPHGPEVFSPPVYRGVVQFLLDNGDLDAQERTLLQQALESLRDSRS